MFKVLRTNSFRKLLLTAFLLTSTFYISSAQLSDYVAPYDCLIYTVTRTLQIDADSNNVYDTYGIQLCGELDIQTFALSAIGDLSRWPPLGIPTRSIVFNNDEESSSFLETYYDSTGSVIAWFQKSSDNDTVYFHSDTEEYNPINFTVDSSSSYIQSYPNPADQVLKINYVVREAADIEIQLLDYEGNFISQILRSPSGQGEYKMVFPVFNLTTGYYRIRFISGSNNYFITVAIVH